MVMKIKQEIPIAPKVTVRPKSEFKFTTPWKANPETDKERFDQSVKEAKHLAKKTGYDTVVFKSEAGFYFTRELKFCEPSIEILYEAKANESKKTL